MELYWPHPWTAPQPLSPLRSDRLNRRVIYAVNHTHSFHFLLFRCVHFISFMWIHVMCLSIFCSAISLALVQSFYWFAIFQISQSKLIVSYQSTVMWLLVIEFRCRHISECIFDIFYSFNKNEFYKKSFTVTECTLKIVFLTHLDIACWCKM